ncbi:MAG: hypothetical protein JSS72_08655 [Armatimonadetes bacterium]|nr:hypothetical protein [Armatimonadota bacterium]
MFKLRKNLDDFQGIPPYASELYGITQPLLGWKSPRIIRWLSARGICSNSDVIRTTIAGNIAPGPQNIARDRFVEPLVVGTPKKHPLAVSLTQCWNSRILDLFLIQVQRFVSQRGRLPQGNQWKQVSDAAGLDSVDAPALVAVQQSLNERHQTRQSAIPILAIMQYESQVASLLRDFCDGADGKNPDLLAKLFQVSKVAALDTIFEADDPLAGIDPRDVSSAALSPVAYMYLYRQYFFDLGSFLGEPVEHVWLAPGTTIELIETSSRRVLVERSLEQLVDEAIHTEKNSNYKDELSEAVKFENQQNVKVGASAGESFSLATIFEAKASQSVDVSTVQKQSRESAHKTTRDITEKVATDLKRSFKTTFRTTTETIDTSSKRHVISNQTDKLLNYELRRKMRRIGVQLQDLGQRLCWQFYVDEPGSDLCLSDMIDAVGAPDMSSLTKPDDIPYEAVKTVKMTFNFQFNPIRGASNDSTYTWNAGNNGGNFDPTAAQQLGNRESADGDESDEQIRLDVPILIDAPPKYKFHQSRFVGAGGGGTVLLMTKDSRRGIFQVGDTFKLILFSVKFSNGKDIPLDFEIDFIPIDEEALKKEVTDANNKNLATYNADKARILKLAFLEALKQRVKNVNAIASRPAWDLREEERTVVYRALVRKLMMESWKLSMTPEDSRIAHVRSEIIRAIFDVDAMLYFVAPEWWQPHTVYNLTTEESFSGTVANDDPAANIEPMDRISYVTDSRAKRLGNYLITEDSNPAPLGSSLGWLLQLDGDSSRNAFLNAPWVKAVLPVRPGMERAALNYILTIEDDPDSLNATYVGGEEEYKHADGSVMTLREVIDLNIAKLEKQNSDFKNTLARDEFYENGFNPLGKPFDDGAEPDKPYSEWISITPTDQIVAVEYKPLDLQV